MIKIERKKILISYVKHMHKSPRRLHASFFELTRPNQPEFSQGFIYLEHLFCFMIAALNQLAISQSLVFIKATANFRVASRIWSYLHIDGIY